MLGCQAHVSRVDHAAIQIAHLNELIHDLDGLIIAWAGVKQ